MASVLSGAVREVGEGFIVLNAGTRIIVSARIRPEGLVPGARVTVKARLQGAEWIAEDVQVDD